MIADTDLDSLAAPPVDVSEWLAAQDSVTHRALRALGELLASIPPQRDRGDAFENFCESVLHCSAKDLVVESGTFSGVGRINVGLALAELIRVHAPEVGPHTYRVVPASWESVEVESAEHHFPSEIALYTDRVLPGLDAVIRFQSSGRGGSTLDVYVRPGDQLRGRELSRQIRSRASELNIFRGRVLSASVVSTGLEFTIIARPTTTRDMIVATSLVWNEIDLNVRAVSSRHSVMTELGLGGRRGVLLAGPPGVGKSAIASVVAAEMVGPFTVVFCDVSAAGALRQVFDECVELGSALVVIEDVDLIVTRRGRSDYLLSEFLAALDSHADAALLVMATTNDVTTLDVAAVRAARFDSIIEVPYPNASVAQQIISVLINGVPGGVDVDCAAVARALPRETSGADIREIVRRAVLQEEPLSTETLLAQISAGRYRPTLPASGGSYI